MVRAVQTWRWGQLLGVMLAFAAGQSTALEAPILWQQITGEYAAMLNQAHYLHSVDAETLLDDKRSQNALKLYLEALDPTKSYFTAGDFATIEAKYGNQIDDLMSDGNPAPAVEIFDVLLGRVKQRTGLALQLLDEAPDFSGDETFDGDFEKRTYLATEAEIEALWRKRVKLDRLAFKVDGMDDAKITAKLKKRYKAIQNQFQWMADDKDPVLEVYLTAVGRSLDPHTSYLSVMTQKNFEIAMTLKLDGIGAKLTQEDGEIKVSSLIKGGAAEKDGRLKKDDIILEVGASEEAPMVDVSNLSLNKAVEKIRGKAGTTVRLKVLPEGKAEPVEYRITRAAIVVAENGAELVEKRGKTAVVKLPSFYNGATADVEKILEELNRGDFDTVIMDLRMNGGGSLDESISLTGLFIDQGPVVQVKDSQGVRVHKDLHRGVAWDKNLIVLTNSFSASASEIFAGAIQDYRRGPVVGEKTTHGKGSVQNLVDLERAFGPQGLAAILGNTPKLPRGAIKITTQQFFLPGGESTQERGVPSDIVLPQLTAAVDRGESTLANHLKAAKIEAARFSAESKWIPEGAIAGLAQKSQARRAASAEFKKLEQRIARFKALQGNKTVSLNEAKFRAQRAEREADEKLLESLESEEAAPAKTDVVLEETLKIADDYRAIR